MEHVLITDLEVPEEEFKDVLDDILYLECDLSENEKKSQIKKLHLQLAHASKDQLEKLI